MYAIMKEVATCSEKACPLFIESMVARVKAVAGTIRQAKAKIILINWVFYLCGLMAGCETINAGCVVAGLVLVSWFVVSFLILIEHKDSPEMKEAANWIESITD